MNDNFYRISDMYQRLITCFGLLLIVSSLFVRATEPVHDVPVKIRIADFKDAKVGAVSYTFDDGLRNQYLIAAPIMEKLQIPGTFFVIPGQVSATLQEAEAKKPGAWGGVTWEEIRTLAAKGFEIGNHGYSHKNLVTQVKEPEELEHEIENSADMIRKETGIFPVSFCYPYNSFNEQVEKIVEKRHVVARTFQQGIGARDTTAENINQWVDKLISQRKWGVAMIHGLTDGFDPLRPDVFESHLTYAKKHEKDLWIDTFGTIGRYIRQRDATTIKDVKIDSNLVSFILNCNLNKEQFDIPLTLVILTENKVTEAKAKQGRESLPVTIQDKQIMIHCTPDSKRVTVKWKYSNVDIDL